MFSFFKKQENSQIQEILTDNNLYSPIQGDFLSLEKVNDPVFSEKAMGDGFAIQPTEDQLIVSPVAGEVTMVAGTKHAIGIHMANGLDILLHLGLDTVNMGGSPFNINIKVGDTVSAGQHLGIMNLEEISGAGYETTVMVIVTNMDVLETLTTNDGSYQAGEKVGTVTVKQ
ncbi:PTS glucose transporter subunit IIA [Leuconostoc sp. MS02]|uniref:PTS glucose transporter subunit IIA n=1 Tax=Leuconostoc aquikimchii TaxID=3236804 RepID=A0ABV3S120_9LACO